MLKYINKDNKVVMTENTITNTIRTFEDSLAALDSEKPEETKETSDGNKD